MVNRQENINDTSVMDFLRESKVKLSDYDRIVSSLSRHELIVLKKLKELYLRGKISETKKIDFDFLVNSFSEQNSKKKNVDDDMYLEEVAIMRALEWLSNKSIIKLEFTPFVTIDLDENGKKYVNISLPEIRLFNYLKRRKQATRKEIIDSHVLTPEEFGIAIGLLKKYDCVDVKKDGNELLIVYRNDLPHTLENDFLMRCRQSFPIVIDTLSDEDKFAVQELLKRKKILKKQLKTKKYIALTKLGVRLLQENLDIEILDRIDYKKLRKSIGNNTKNNPEQNKLLDFNSKFILRRYDVLSKVPEKLFPKKHLIDVVLDYFRQIWLSMGFEEMQGKIIDTSFNVLDALFVPQDHPARSLQDTIYVADCDGQQLKGEINTHYGKLMCNIHERGVYKGKRISIGWRYLWQKQEAQKLMARSHTTVLSFLKLFKSKPDQGKYFSLGKVFRNETQDWKHNFQFYQVEGIVVHEEANLKNHFYFITEFFKRLGFKKVRLRPSYFPYTEPSMEVDVYSELRDEWIELGGSGIFRPEVVIPIFGKFVPVLAWGLGFDRFVMLLFGINDIRELYTKDIEKLMRQKLLRIKF